MVARDSADAIRFSVCELALRIASPWRRLFICLDTKREWLVRQSAQHRDTKDNDAILAIDKTEKADERVGSWNRWRNRRGMKKEEAKTEREKKIEWKIRRSERTIAKTHERKATRWNSQVIHSACQRGFPCGKRYRRGTEEKEKEAGYREREKKRGESTRERRDRRKRREKQGHNDSSGNGDRARPYKVARHRTRAFSWRGSRGSQENCQQSSDCIVAPKGKVHRPLENLLTYGNRARLSFTLLFVARWCAADRRGFFWQYRKLQIKK